MNPYIFVVARTYSSQMSLQHRYQNHEQYVEIILSAPAVRVEKQVEEYFKDLFDSLGIQIRTPLLVPEMAPPLD